MPNDNAYPPFVVPGAPRTPLGSYLVQGGAWSPDFTLRGNLSREMRAHVWNMSWGHCFYCGTNYLNPFDNLVIEHVVPLARGGTNEIENLVPACSNCNFEKGLLLLNEWRVARPYGEDPDDYPWLREWLDGEGNPTERPVALHVDSRLTSQFFFERWETYQHLRADECNAYHRMMERRMLGFR